MTAEDANKRIFARAREAAERAALAPFVFDPDPGELPEQQSRASIGMEPAALAAIIDRACGLFEQATGRPPDRRLEAEAVARWLRVPWLRGLR